MQTHYDELQAQGIRLRVMEVTGSKGPFIASVSCGVTGNNLGGVEGCATLERAIESGKKHARKFTY